MYQQPYFIPGFYSGIGPAMMRGGAMNTALHGLNAGRGMGLFSRIGSGIHALRGLNWGGIINNTSRTLGLINQAIPVVKQVGPMMNNVKSMLKVASVFKDETDSPRRHKRTYPKTYPTSSSHSTDTSSFKKTTDPSSFIEDDYSPTFFVAS